MNRFTILPVCDGIAEAESRSDGSGSSRAVLFVQRGITEMAGRGECRIRIYESGFPHSAPLEGGRI